MGTRTCRSCAKAGISKRWDLRTGKPPELSSIRKPGDLAATTMLMTIKFTLQYDRIGFDETTCKYSSPRAGWCRDVAIGLCHSGSGAASQCAVERNDP